MTQHAYSAILPDCLSLVFAYHIHIIPHFTSASDLSPLDKAFFAKFLTCIQVPYNLNIDDYLSAVSRRKCRSDWSKKSISSHPCTLPKSSRSLYYLSLANNTFISSETFRYLHGIHILDISNTDTIRYDAFEDFVHIQGIQSLNINQMHDIQGSAFKYLSGIKDLSMFGCAQVRCQDLHFLKSLESLDMSSCKQLTDAALQPLRNLKTLRIKHCSKITDKAFENLTELEELDMESVPHATDEAFFHLRKLKRLDISYCMQLTGRAFEYLGQSGLQSLTMKDCQLQGITNEAFREIGATLEFLHMSGSHLRSLDDRMFEYFANGRLKKLVLIGCTQFTKGIFAHLKGVHHLALNRTGIRVEEEDLEYLEECLDGVKTLRVSLNFAEENVLWDVHDMVRYMQAGDYLSEFLF